MEVVRPGLAKSIKPRIRFADSADGPLDGAVVLDDRAVGETRNAAANVFLRYMSDGLDVSLSRHGRTGAVRRSQISARRSQLLTEVRSGLESVFIAPRNPSAAPAGAPAAISDGRPFVGRKGRAYVRVDTMALAFDAAEEPITDLIENAFCAAS